MSATNNVTPAKFRCDFFEASCPSIHEAENGDIVFIGEYVSQGELKTMGIGYRADGESAVRYPREFVEAYFMEYAAKRLANSK